MPTLVRPRHTVQRRLVLRAVKVSPAARTAEEVAAIVQRWRPRVGTATVYRNLALLAQRGELVRFAGPDGIQRFTGYAFQLATFTCQRCGRAEQLRIPSLPAVVRRATRGQTIFSARLDVQGLCRDHAPRRRA